MKPLFESLIGKHNIKNAKKYETLYLLWPWSSRQVDTLLQKKYKGIKNRVSVTLFLFTEDELKNNGILSLIGESYTLYKYIGNSSIENIIKKVELSSDSKSLYSMGFATIENPANIF